MSFGGGSGSSSIAGSTDVVLSSPTNKQVLGYNSSLVKWQNQTIVVPDEVYAYTYQGDIAVMTGVSRQYFDTAYTIDTVRVGINTSPTGSTLIVDVKKNGTSIYSGNTANRPTIAAAGHTGTGGAPTTATLASGDYITIDIVQVGSTLAGSDLTVTIRLTKS